MAVVNGYCTAQQIREELSDADTKLSAALLAKAVNAASRAVDDWCGRRFWKDPGPTVLLYRPTDREVAAVHDIATEDGLVVKTDTAGDGTWATTWVLGTDFQLEDLNAPAAGWPWEELVAIGGKTFTPYRRGRLRRGRPTLQVTATHGWPAVPAQVEEATVLRGVAFFKRKEAPFGVQSFGDFGMRITRKDPDVMDLLRNFQKPLAA